VDELISYGLGKVLKSVRLRVTALRKAECDELLHEFEIQLRDIFYPTGEDSEE